MSKLHPDIFNKVSNCSFGLYNGWSGKLPVISWRLFSHKNKVSNQNEKTKRNFWFYPVMVTTAREISAPEVLSLTSM